MTIPGKEDKSRALYFLGILPPENIREEITAFKEVVKTKFNSSRSLNAPPHITFIPPFWYEYAKEETLLAHLDKFNERFSSFEITLNDFGSFPPRTLYINVAENSALSKCQNSLRSHFEVLQLNQVQRFGFHAHVTIASKDLAARTFPEADEFFQSLSYRRTFTTDRISLLRLRRKKWKEI